MSSNVKLLTYLRNYNEHQLDAMLYQAEHKPKIYKKMILKQLGEPQVDHRYTKGLTDLAKHKKK